jgi:hypothetical protein
VLLNYKKRKYLTIFKEDKREMERRGWKKKTFGL